MTNRPFPIDPTLTGIAVGYRNPAVALIGRRVLPPLPVLTEAFKYTSYPLAEGFTYPETKVGRKGQPNQVEFTGIETAGATTDYGLDDAIPNSDIAAAARARAEQRSLIDPEAMAAQGLTNYIELAREIRVATLVQDASNYSTGRKVTLSSGDQFSDTDGADPLGVIDTALGGTLVYRANTLAMGYAVWAALKKNPVIVKAIKGNNTDVGFVTKQQFAELFELKPENILVGEGLINTAKKGQAPTLSRVWGKNIAALYVDPTKQDGNDGILSYGFTAELGGRVSGSIDDPDIGIEGGKRVRVGERVAEFVCAKDLGYLITDAVA